MALIIIGEKINGTLKSVGQAVLARDEGVISDLARRQSQAGADYLDVNAGTSPDREAMDLTWLITVVQKAVETSICVDSPNPDALATVLPLLRRPGIINSVNGEPGRLAALLPLASRHQAGVVALLMDEHGIPDTAAGRLDVAGVIARAAAAAGVSEGQLLFDPLAMSIATRPDAGRVFIDTTVGLRARYPSARVVSGLSNVSFGLPARRALNGAFLALAVGAGMDAAIMDPLDPDLTSLAYAAQVIAGFDERCRQYLSVYRKGRIA